MSISSFQEKFLGKGCGNIVVGLFAAVLLFGTFSQCNRNRGDDPAKQNEAEAVVVRVGNIPLGLGNLQKGVSDRTTDTLGRMSEQGQVMTTLPLQLQASLAATELLRQLQSAAVVYLIEKQGIAMTDDALLKAQSQMIDESIETVKQDLIMKGKLKPNATAKELDEALKTQTNGKTLAEIRQMNQDKLKADLADPSKKNEAKLMLSNGILISALRSKFTPTDADLKASYDNYVVKRIVFTQKPSPTQPAAERAAKALADLKGGKSFESLMDTVSDELAQPNKKKSEVTTTISGTMIDSKPEYKDLKGKQPGYLTAAVDVPEGKAIYKLVSIKSDIPKDFATRKATYATELANQRASRELQKQLKDVLSSGVLKWENNGWKCLFDFAQSFSAGPDVSDAKLKEVVEAAKKIVNGSNPVELQPATLALFAASNALYSSPTANKAALTDSRIEALNLVLKSNPDYDLYIELSDLYASKKDGAKVAESLLAASKNNTTYDAEGQRKFGDIAGRSIKFKADGVITDDQLKQLEAQQAVWRKSKIDFDTAVTEGKKKEEELKKQNEAELARQKAEAALKAGSKPSTGIGGSTPGGGLLDGNTAPPTAPPTGGVKKP